MISFLFTFDVLLTVLYCAIFLLYLRAFFSIHRPFGRVYMALLPAVLALHLVKLILQGVHEGSCPLVAFGETFSFTAFSLGVVYLYMERSRRYDAAGTVFVGIIMLFQSVALFGHPAVLPSAGAGRIPFGVHAPMALIGIAAFAASALYGGMYLVMQGLLKSKHFGSLTRSIPPLLKVAAIQKSSSALGVVFFGAAIVAGLFLGVHYGRITSFDPKIIISVVVLAIFGYGVVGSRYFAFSDKKGSVIAIAGFLLAIISMITVRFFLPTFHRF